jgi:hypothetical protein
MSTGSQVAQLSQTLEHGSCMLIRFNFEAVELLEYIKIKYLSDIMSTDIKGPDIEDFCVLKPISLGAFG